MPLDWAETQNHLGHALEVQGERESGTARLEEAVVVLRGALEERTRERAPLQWATTLNNLGIALETLGKRESGTAHLMEAVAAWEACLTIAESSWPPAWVQDVRSHLNQARAENARRVSQ